MTLTDCEKVQHHASITTTKKETAGGAIAAAMKTVATVLRSQELGLACLKTFKYRDSQWLWLMAIVCCEFC